MLTLYPHSFFSDYENDQHISAAADNNGYATIMGLPATYFTLDNPDEVPRNAQNVYDNEDNPKFEENNKTVYLKPFN